MRKLLVTGIILLAVLFTNIAALAESTVSVDKSNLDSGVVEVNYASDANKKVKLMVEKNGVKYTYNLQSMNSSERFPLQLGNGEYRISVLENTQGTKYRYVYSELVKLDLEKANSVYLASVQSVKWNESMKTVKKAKELTQKLKTDAEKVKAVYTYLVNNFSYDYDKLSKLPYNYLPSIDATLKSKTGICYDFSSMFASMLRSLDIPTKLVTGYTDNAKGFHAWNEVWMEADGKWMTVDTTYDIQAREAKARYKMEKDVKQYSKAYQY